VARVPRYALALAHCRARVNFDPNQSRDDDGKFSDGVTFGPSARAGGHMVCIFTDDDGIYGSGAPYSEENEGQRYLAMRFYDGGSKNWRAEHLDESVLVPLADARQYAETLGAAADAAKAAAVPDVERDADGEFPAPQVISETRFGEFVMTGYHDFNGDRISENTRFITIGTDGTRVEWDDAGALVLLKKAPHVADGIRKLLDDNPADRLANFDPTQKRDEHGRWTDGFMSDTALDAVADLVSIVDEIERDNVQPSMRFRGTSGETLLFKLPDGRKIIRKRIADYGVPEAAKRDADAEQLGSLVAGALEVRAPRVYRVGNGEMFIEFAPGELIGNADLPITRTLDELPDQRMVTRIGLLDALTGNNDRHDGNLIVDNGEVTAIDQGLAWSWIGIRKYGMDAVDSNRPGARFVHHDLPSFQGQAPWVENPMTDADVELTRERLEALRPDFKRVGREDWLDHSLSMLDEIALYAEGGESIYG
jgi:hypothetical protein